MAKKYLQVSRSFSIRKIFTFPVYASYSFYVPYMELITEYTYEIKMDPGL